VLGRTDLARLVQEAGPALAGSVFHRSWLADNDTWVVLFQKPDESRLALEIGLEPETAHFCAVSPQEAAKSGKDDTHFFLVALRKHLGEKKLERITHVAGDRIAVLDFGDLKLVVELTGRASNLIIIKRDDEILITLRAGRPQRPLDPGLKWAPPAPREGPEEIFRPEIAPDPKTLAVSKAVLEEARRIGEERDALDHRTALLRSAQNGEKRVRGLVTKLEKERDEAQQAEKFRQQGELLKANVGKIKKGQTKVTVVDFFSPDQREVELELDPLEPVMDQARALFKRAKKLDRGLVSIETRLGEADAEAETLTRLRTELEAVSAEDTESLDRIHKELAKIGHAPRVQAPPEKKKKPKDEPRGPRKFLSRDGFEILVGRSNTENDELTIRTARGNDLFFHVRGFPGSHVIVRTKKDKSVPLETLLDAGALAVHYSKVRGNTRADVSYCPRKYVSKPRGAKPGLVTVANEKTIRPDGDPERLKRLLATAGQREDPDSKWDEVEDAVESS
jgi:predicted ribosome quality control (RQC) complex YloA/Tae2 family protein